MAATAIEQNRTDRALVDWMDKRDLLPTIEKIRPFTMVPEGSLYELGRQTRAVLASGIPGDFVECGVWRGGASFLMAELVKQAGAASRKVWLFDSFEGLPAPEQIDGPSALNYVQRPGSPWYFNNCRASLQDVQQTAVALGLASLTELVKGWFDESLAAYRDRIGPIAILRLDCDWYASVRCCLENLYDQVVEGGFVILDDYYTYDGCALAVHEFLGSRGLSHRIETVSTQWGTCECPQGAVFRKGDTTWSQLKVQHQLEIVRQEVATITAPGETFILVDQQQLEAPLLEDRTAVPFPERNGQYWGPPEDDKAAIRELERLRGLGANVIVFAWPAFWWLEHYGQFDAYLHSRFRRVLENEQLVVFDLR